MFDQLGIRIITEEIQMLAAKLFENNQWTPPPKVLKNKIIWFTIHANLRNMLAACGQFLRKERGIICQVNKSATRIVVLLMIHSAQQLQEREKQGMKYTEEAYVKTSNEFGWQEEA